MEKHLLSYGLTETHSLGATMAEREITAHIQDQPKILNAISGAMFKG
jgi:hypothetical protein